MWRLAFILLCFPAFSQVVPYTFSDPQVYSKSSAVGVLTTNMPFDMYDDFSIPLTPGNVNGTTTTTNGATWSSITRTVTDTRGIISVESPIPTFFIGDSKTELYPWRVLVSDSTYKSFEYPSMLAKSGWSLSDGALFLTNYLNALPATPTPANALINLGINSISFTNEAYIKTNFWNMSQALLGKWPSLKIGIVPIWSTSFTNESIYWDSRIEEFAASNTTFCFLGPYEKYFMTNSAWSSDGYHPDLYAGWIEWGARCRTNLLVNGGTNTLTLGAYLKYNTNSPSSYGEQILSFTTNSLNTTAAAGKSYRWRMMGTAGIGVGTSEDFRISDVLANNWGFTLNMYEGSVTNKITTGPWYQGDVSRIFDFQIVQFRGYNFQFMVSNGTPYLVNVNFYNPSGNNFTWTLRLKNINLAIYQVAYAMNPWLPTPLIQDNFNNALVSDGKAFNNYDYKDYTNGWWANGTNVSWTQQKGVWTTITNTLRPSDMTGTTNSIATVPGAVDAVVFAKQVGTNAGLVIRFTDTNNFIYCQHTGFGGTFNLHCVVSGVDRIVKTTSPAWTYISSFTDLYAVGSNVTASFGAAHVNLGLFTITNSELMTGTNIGVLSMDATNGIQQLGAFSITGHHPELPYGTQ